MKNVPRETPRLASKERTRTWGTDADDLRG